MAVDGGIAVEARGQSSRAAMPADYLALLKPRVMSLVVLTGAVGLLLAPGALHPVLAAVAILCIAVGAGAAGCINMWYERDIDALMARTRHRPLPSGRIAPRSALEFGVMLAVGCVAFMGLALNWLAAALLAATIAFYVFVYTVWLKRRTPQNIVIGGAAGALPPVIGWAAASGDIALVPVALFAIVFFWTPPHFWSLALCRADEYAAAGIPMLPVVAGAAATRRWIVAYSAVLLPLALAPFALGATSPLYAAGATALSAVFLGGALRLARGTSDERMRSSALWLFRYSILYLALLFGLLALDDMFMGPA